jgi:hypothetical protein
MEMSQFRTVVAGAVVVSGLTAGALGLGAAVASADPPPPPPLPAEQVPGPPPPDWAPPKPIQPVWSPDTPVVWDPGWGGKWGMWVNGQFITLT